MKFTTQYEPVIGFEVHVELGTNTKMFCACPADHFGKLPNTQTCPVCLGLPGALPVPNRKAVEWCIKLGLTLNCEVNLFSKFDRKNYFYPDLPKGYQISQYDIPFCHSGQIKLTSGRSIRIIRVHLEEDTGKLQHSGKNTLIDFNRSGVPLVEIVTEPDFDNSADTTEFLKEIQSIVRALGISSADMEKGSMRLEANISIREAGAKKLPDYKVEIKNVNSFRFIKKALEFEIMRQSRILASGAHPIQETRGFKESTGETHSQRRKEAAHDYRYFPDPDIPPIQFTNQQINEWRNSLPELPAQTRAKLAALGVSPATAAIIVASPTRLQKFNDLTNKQFKPLEIAKLLANLPEDQVLHASMHDTSVLSDKDAIRVVAQKVLAANPKAVTDIKSGKTQVLFFLLGQLKKELASNIDVPLATKILRELI